MPERFQATLAAYETAKRETLANEGPSPLRRELAKLTRFLDGAGDPHLEDVDVDVEFRRAKARVLQTLLAQHERGESKG